jgi:hypothetical protein
MAGTACLLFNAHDCGHQTLCRQNKSWAYLFMTQKARIVLQDAQRAIANHTDALQSEEFRASWFAVVGLLRAVGHVLANEDARSSEGMKRAIEEKWAELWRTKPEPKIFWKFILHERNRFLKNYEHGIVRTRTQSQVAPDGGDGSL